MTDVLPAPDIARRPTGCRVLRLALACYERPLVTVAVVAFAARFAVVVAAQLLTDRTIVPDEGQYLVLAKLLAEGHPAENYLVGYGHSLYRTTWAFTQPLVVLTHLFGAHYFNGRLLAAMAGMLAAVLTTKVLLHRMTRSVALGAGLLMALWPSQIFWSSASLRESMVWLGLVLTALGIAWLADESVKRWLGGAAVAAAGLGLVGLLRDQTMVAATWAFLVSAALLPGRRRAAKFGAALVLAGMIPLATGAGAFGWTLVTRAIPKLGTLRIYGEMDAATGFVPTTTVPPGGPATSTTIATTTTTTQPGQILVANQYLVDETAKASLRQLPRGLLATTLRPMPWEPATSGAMSVARFENLLWFPLYLLAVIGAWTARKRRDLVAFPALCLLAVTTAAAVSQGNLGTAFRHRAQILWALAILGSLGAHATLTWASRRFPRGT